MAQRTTKTYSKKPTEETARKASAGRTTQRRNTNKNRGGRRKIRKEAIAVLVIAFAVLVLFIGSIIHMATKKDGLEVFAEEQSIGIIQLNKAKDISADTLMQTVTAQLKEEKGSDVQINEKLTLKPIHISSKNKKEVVTVDYIIPKIRETVTYKVAAAVITVDGTTAAVLANEKEANDLLKAIQDAYVPEGTTMETGFVEKVEVTTQFVDSGEIISSEAAKKKFQEGTKVQKTYTVQSGDTISKIAASAGMTTEEFLEANAGMTIETPLKIGQTVNIAVEKPFVSVKTIETVTKTEVAKKEYEYREDNTKNKGYKKVVQQGKDGQKEVTTQIIRVNGFEESQKEVSSKFITDPVTEIIVQGTK